MRNKLKKILVNMPDCSNLLFTFDDNNKIIKSKRVADRYSKNTKLYSKLFINIQSSIETFLNPNAI